jgi:hypothetical protein
MALDSAITGIVLFSEAIYTQMSAAAIEEDLIGVFVLVVDTYGTGLVLSKQLSWIGALIDSIGIVEYNLGAKCACVVDTLVLVLARRWRLVVNESSCM